MRIFLICVYLIIQLPIFSQSQYIFKQLTTNDGLSNNTILDIYQDNTGCIWFATYDGLTIYDGKDFKVLRYDPLFGDKGLPKGQAKRIIADNNGYKWILFENNQLVRLVDKTGNCKIYNIPSSSTIKYTMLKDKSGNLVIECDTCYYSYQKKTDRFIPLSQNSETYIDIKQTQILKSEISSEFTKNHSSVNLFDVYISDLHQEVVVSTTNAGVWIKRNKETGFFKNYRNFKSGKDNIPTNEIYCSLIDREGNLWLGTKDAGVVMGQRVESLTSENGLFWEKNDAESNGTIRAIFKDEHYLVLGTYNNGIEVYKNNKSRSYSFKEPDGERWNWIRSLFKDSKGNIWIGSYAGLTKTNSEFSFMKRFVPGSNNTSIRHNRIYSIAENKNGFVYFGAWGGIDVFNPESNTFIEFDSLLNLPPLHVRKLMFDSKGFLWVGTESSGVYKLDVNNNSIVRHFIEEGEVDTKISSNSIFDICEDYKGNIYLGTFGGVNLISQTGKIDRLINVNNQIPTTLVYKLFWVNDGNLWFSTSKCLAKLSVAEQNVRIYDTNDGFPISDYTEGAGFQDQSGSLFFGGNNGVMGFNPEKIRTNRLLPVLYIHDFWVDNKEVQVGNKDSVYTFTSSSENVDLELSGFMLNQPGKTKLAWKLIPYEKEFTVKNSQDAKLHYSDLPSGNYSLVVKASNADHIWSKPNQILSFSIPKPFWQETYFFILIFLFISATIIVIIRWRFNLIRKRNIHLEQIIEQRTEKINKQKQDLEQAFSELENKNEKLLAQRDKILSQHEHLLEMHAQMEELNVLKQKFFTNVSHDIRTPLTLISGPLTELMGDESLDCQHVDTLERMKYNVNYIVQLLDQVLDKKSLELGGLQKIMTQGDVVGVCKSVINSFKDQVTINKQNIEFLSSHGAYYMRFDYDKLQQIIYNIIANAVKFTDKGGTISCNLQIHDNDFELCISDTGIGISPDRLEFIFDRYYQINKSSNETKGNGIGLSMVSDFVKLLEGEIKVESEPGKGTLFFLSFGIEKEKDDVLQLTEIQALKTKSNVSVSDNIEEKNTVLIVEDNDQLRLYLKQLLDKKYKVITAQNGQVAQEILRKNKAFDLIISDWMMSLVDGITLCKYVKKKDSLNHIPFLILSALGQVENQKEGYLAGADDYISKPFEPEIFFLKIENLINRQKTVEQTAKVDALIQPEIKNEKTFDEKLVLKINEVLNENLSNTDFNQHVLAEKLGVSQMQLYRRVKGNLLQTPNELIRSARIKKAKSLLSSNSNYTINEVSYMSGFNDPKYFSRCFTKEYGMSPTEFKCTK